MGCRRNKLRSVLLAAASLVAVGAALPAAAASGRERAPVQEPLLPRHSSGRVLIVVSTDQQKLTVYDDGVPVAETTVSTGVADHPTPHGIFSIIAKEKFHRSNLYSDAPMPWMQRITWSGVALHEGRVTGRPASHGCIRMPARFAVDLFRYTREGARVIIARDDVVPMPWGGLAPFGGSPIVTRLGLTDPRPAATKADAPPLPADVEIESRPRVTPATTSPGGRDIAAKAPLSLLVSRKTGKLYVRRAFTPVFELPITIDDPGRPLGEHLFVMQESRSRWLATTATAPVREASLIDEGPKSRRAREARMISLPPSDAQDALSRIHFPPGATALIESLLTPGASLIVSDDGARNRETWAGTNFIALSE